MSGFIVGLLYLVSLAFLITLFFTYLLRNRGPWNSFWIFFFIVLLSVLAADIWIQPVGPIYQDVYWVPPLAVGLLIALLLAATTPSPQMRNRILNEKEKELTDNQRTYAAFGTFFWVVFLLLFVLVIVGWYNNYIS